MDSHGPEAGGLNEESFLRAVLDETAQMVYVFDSTGRPQWWNQAVRERSGRSAEELESMTAAESFQALVVDADRERATAAIDQLLEQETLTVELSLRANDGESVPFEFRGSTAPVADETAYMLLGYEISDRVERERELEQYAAVVETTRDGVYIVGPDGRFEMVNDAYVEMTGYDREELIGEPASRVVAGDTAAEAQRLERELREGERETATLVADLRRADGSSFPAEASFSLVETEGGYRRVAVVRDVSDHMEREKRLAAQFRQQDAVAELGRIALDRDDDLDVLLSDACAVVRDVLDTSHSKVLDLQSDAETLTLRAGAGWDDSVVGEATVSAVADDSQAAYTLSVSEPVVVRNLDADPRFSGPDLLRDEGVTSGVSVVIGPHDDPWGILETHDTDRREFADHDVNFVQSVATLLATAIEREGYERELRRYETLVEESRDVNAVLAPDGTFDYVTPSVANVLGYDPADLAGEVAFDYVHEADAETVVGEFEHMVADPSYRPSIEFRFRHADGTWRVIEARGRNLLDDPDIGGVVAYTRDVTERRQRERRLEVHRERLATLNALNTVVQQITHTIVEAPDRSSIEQTVCERLVETDEFVVAWVGELDPHGDGIRPRTNVGGEAALADVDISVQGDDGPAVTALRRDAVQTTREGDGEADVFEWGAHGCRSMAAIPVAHEDAHYGVLCVYAERPDAFAEDVRTVFGRLGRVVGHAIRAVERRRALVSEEIVELEVRLQGVLDGVPGAADPDARVTIEEVVPLSEGAYVEYGTATPAGLDVVEGAVEALDHWESVEVVDEGEAGERARFHVRLSEPPVMAVVGDLGGEVGTAELDGGELAITIRLPQGADVRRVIEGLRETYPGAELVRQRRRAREDRSVRGLRDALDAELTERQQTALTLAHSAGYFDWPRDTTGEDLAETMDIAPPTFHDHLRRAQQKVFEAVLGDGT